MRFDHIQTNKDEIKDIHEFFKGEMIAFGKWVSEKRKNEGKTLDELAKITGIDKSYIHRLEKGERTNPSFITVYSLATALGKDIREIIKLA
ncbi:helix-turn-helix domain-containing protein [Paenibacillus polymyxa]|uniref:helix-turn-helix domain-containing protein n=1 Tax=Paenibacillus polymyxa TaxID=1406 RepID=UPI0001E6BF99|nr:helix-turn-helix transcriptional regulator [Paenibacillus polymyxa]WPQ59863.1 helix-turn-helix transcriptional regulator [Paenibacillus polymyxa]